MSTVVNGRFLPQRPGGLQRTARSLVEALRTQGLDLEILCPQPDPLADRVLEPPAGRLGGQLWEQVLLPRAARGRPVLSLANTAPVAARRSTVLVHDLAPLVGPQWFRPSMRAYGQLVLAGARRADLVVTVSHAVAAELTAAGIGRVAVVPPAVDSLFSPAAPAEVEAVRRRFALDLPWVLLPGWADPRKDLTTALAASRGVDIPHLLVLVGGTRGVFAPVRPPAGRDIRLLGHVSDDDLRALLTGAHAVLYPSRYEGFGLPPLEAAACGTPALVSDLPVLRESAPDSVFARVGDVSAWRAALHEVLDGPRPPVTPPTRTWSDAGRELAALL